MLIELKALERLGDGIECVQVIVGEAHERLFDAGRFYYFLTDCCFKQVTRIDFRDGVAKGVRGFEVCCGEG